MKQELVNGTCGDNRFDVITKAKEHLLRATNIQDSPEEMAVLDNILFRCWQMGWLKKYEEEPTCKKSLQVEEEHPDNFTSFEWLIGRLMFRGCDLWGMTDGEDDNGVVTKLIKDRAAEMMELLERKLDPLAEPVDLENEIKEWITPRNPSIDPKKETISGEVYIDCIIVTARHFYKLGLNARKEVANDNT